MNWFLLALLAPLAWSVVNYIDKYLLLHFSKHNQAGSGGLLILSSFVSLVAAIIVFCILGLSGITVANHTIFLLVLSGIFEALYILFYFWALEHDSTVTVVALFQFAPIMGLLFGFFILGEIPTSTQMIAVGLILFGTLFIIKKKGRHFSLNLHVFLLMLVSTAFVGIYSTLFKLVGEDIPFWTSMFWQYLGITFVGLVLFVLVPKFRAQTINMVTVRKGTTLTLTGIAEFMNILALIATNAAILLAPVALVLSVSSVQPAFVLIEGTILAYYFPRLVDSSDKPKFMVQYVVGILLICIGGFLIY